MKKYIKASSNESIIFKSLNIDGDTRTWRFESVDDIVDAWNSPDADVPANDDPIWDVYVGDKHVLREAVPNKSYEDSVWFEDLLTYLGVDIWGM